MKLGFKLVLYVLILNLVSGLIYTLGVPGTEYSYSATGSGSAEDYVERFNSTEMMENQQPGIIATFPYLGNIYGTIMYLWNAVKFIVAGFPTLLSQLAGFIPDGEGRVAFQAISVILGALFSFIIFGWLFQVITGRQTED